MDTSSSANSDPISQALALQPLSNFEVVPAQTKTEDVSSDFDYARGNMINILEKGNEALSDMLGFAQQSQHPRGYEVVATLIKTLSETNKDLLELSKKRKDIEGMDSPSTINNNLFVGSTTDLLKLLKKNNAT